MIFTHTTPRPQWGDRCVFWHAGVITRQMFCQSIHGFWISDPQPKFCYLHRIGWSILQQCKHCRAILWKMKTRRTHATRCVMSVVLYTRWTLRMVNEQPRRKHKLVTITRSVDAVIDFCVALDSNVSRVLTPVKQMSHQEYFNTANMPGFVACTLNTLWSRIPCSGLNAWLGGILFSLENELDWCWAYWCASWQCMPCLYLLHGVESTLRRQSEYNNGMGNWKK